MQLACGSTSYVSYIVFMLQHGLVVMYYSSLMSFAQKFLVFFAESVRWAMVIKSSFTIANAS